VPREIKTIKLKERRNGGEIALCRVEELAGKECHKDYQAFFKVMRWRERK